MASSASITTARSREANSAGGEPAAWMETKIAATAAPGHQAEPPARSSPSRPSAPQPSPRKTATVVAPSDHRSNTRPCRLNRRVRRANSPSARSSRGGDEQDRRARVGDASGAGAEHGRGRQPGEQARGR